MRNRLILLTFFLFFASFSGWYYASYQSHETVKTKGNILPSNVKDPNHRLKPEDSARSVSSINKIKKDSDFNHHSPYFKKLLKDKSGEKIYNRSLEIFKDLTEHEGMARWITLGLRFESSQEFGEEFKSSLNRINQNPHEVLNKISEVYKKLNDNEYDSFIQAMLINVVHQLEVSKDQKISFYSERLGDKFELDDNGNPTASSLNITNSMAFLNQYKFDKENIKQKIEASLNDHKENKKNHRELAERFIVYFPEFKPDIDRWRK